VALLHWTTRRDYHSHASMSKAKVRGDVPEAAIDSPRTMPIWRVFAIFSPRLLREMNARGGIFPAKFNASDAQ
jgi:hypothetical protein